jgi:hypothetical protein
MKDATSSAAYKENRWLAAITLTGIMGFNPEGVGRYGTQACSHL